jgi:hypothetical protein
MIPQGVGCCVRVRAAGTVGASKEGDVVATSGVWAVVEKGTNYIFHLQAVAGVNYRNAYGDAYATTVSEDDKRCLKRHEGLLSFGDGAQSPLAHHFIMLPASLNLESQGELDEYFALVADAVASRSGQVIAARYRDKLQDAERMHHGYVDGLAHSYSALDASLAEPIRDLAAVWRGGFDAFDSMVWPAEGPKLAAAARELDALFGPERLVERLERRTGLAFGSSGFAVSLCAANANGPDAIDMGYSRNLHYYGHPTDVALNLVCHEICVRMLLPVLVDAMAAGDDARWLWDALESLADLYTADILGTSLDALGGLAFAPILRGLLAATPTLEPQELVTLAVERRRAG